jgi:hypothetical protein
MPRAFVCLLVAPVLVALTVAGGCQQLHLGGQPAKPKPAVTEETALKAEVLQEDLIYFSDRFAAVVSAAADEIASSTDDREVIELTLRWKLRHIPMMQEIVRTEDPRRAFLDAWAMCARMRVYLQEGEGRGAFKNEQQRAIEAAVQLEERIIEIGRRFMTPPELDQAAREVEAFADSVPMTGRFAVDLIRASHETDLHGPGLASLLSIPISGVTESAEAIDHVARVAAVMTEVLEELPERTRWQTQLLLLESEKLDTVVSVQQDLTRLTQGIESLMQIARTMPEDVRVQLEAVIESADAAQGQLQTNLQEARATIGELDAALDKAGDTTTDILEVMDRLNEAAIAWEATADGRPRNRRRLVTRRSSTSTTTRGQRSGSARRPLRFSLSWARSTPCRTRPRTSPRPASTP